MTDNRTNEPTPEQVEAAAKAIWDIDDSQVLDPPWDQLDEKFKRHYRTLARAALVAAAGAAPQAESVPTSKYISPHLPSMIRNLWKSDPSENSVRTALKLAGDLIQELIDLRAAPVQSSSTVDEAALAEVITEHGYDSYRLDYCTCGEKVKADMAEHTAHAIVEHLTGGMK